MKLIIFISSLIISMSSIPHDEYSFKFSIKDKEKLITAQEGVWWCWAASLEALYKYQNIKVEQADIIKAFLNRDYIIPSDYISSQAGLSSYSFKKYLSVIKKGKQVKIKDIKNSIKKNIPVLAIYKAHVAIITGVKYENNEESFEIMDPNFKIGKYEAFQTVSKNELSFQQTGQPSILIAVSDLWN